MGYYNDEKNVAAYIEMADGYIGHALINTLEQYIPDGSTVLELGMGPGTDLLLLAQYYRVTGSDFAEPFLQRFRRQHPDIDLMLLDAVTLETNRTFDAIYSNKVLYHLTPAELRQSFTEQLRLLKPGGIALHSFWYGEKPSEEMNELHFEYHTYDTLRDLIDPRFSLQEVGRYGEIEPDDSLFIVLKKRFM